MTWEVKKVIAREKHPGRVARGHKKEKRRNIA